MGIKDGGSRGVTVRVKSARGRTTSSKRWLERQLNDPYVARARKEGYRSRAAYKLIELDEKFGFLRSAQSIVDLGAAPGGWTQVCVKRAKKHARIVGMDLKEMDAIEGAILIVGDFMADAAPAKLIDALGGKADLVLSDMSPNASGQPSVDHDRIILLCEASFDFALEVLKPGGSFIAKVFQGGTEKELLARMKQHFTTVKHAKPKASRADSAETYVVALGFKA